MTSGEASLTISQNFSDDHFLPLEPIEEHGIEEEECSARKQSRFRGTSFFPPVTRTATAGAQLTNVSGESPRSSATYTSTVQEAARRFITRQHSSSFSITSASQIPSNMARKRISTYDHIQARIYTGLPRTHSISRREMDTYQLGPSRKIDWNSLKENLESDKQIYSAIKSIKFNSGNTPKTQTAELANIVRLKLKYLIAATMNFSEDRYKIVVEVSAVQKTASGLHIASRCLWNTATDHSITIKIQGVDCEIIIVAFLFYTDLGNINSN